MSGPVGKNYAQDGSTYMNQNKEEKQPENQTSEMANQAASVQLGMVS